MGRRTGKSSNTPIAMPPKTAVAPHQTTKGSPKAELNAINAYIAQKPDFDKLIDEAKQNPQSVPEKQTTDYDRKLYAGVKESLDEARNARESKEAVST